jgi:hypothetical protein
VSNDEKDPAESSEAGRDSKAIVEGGGFMGPGLAPGLSASVLSGGPDDGSSEMGNEDGSWKSHALEEKRDPGGRGGLRRALRRWFGR